MAFTAGVNKTDNVRLGTCVIIYNGSELGFTTGGVEVELSTTTKEIKVDQYGDTPVDDRIMGRTVMVKCPVAETSIEQIANTMLGTVRYSTGGDKIEIRSGTGISLLANAQELILRPVDLHGDGASPDRSEDFIVHLAAAPGALQFAYKYDDQRVFNLEFRGYADPANNGRICTYGDPAATL